MPRSYREIEQEMEQLMVEANRLFSVRFPWRRLPGVAQAWLPSMDMYESEDSFILRFELPGIKPEEVDISMSGDTLSLKGERQPPEGIKEEEWQSAEICYGPFSRFISIPSAVNADKIEANFENGILEIRLPKAEELKPKQIKVQTRELETNKSK